LVDARARYLDPTILYPIESVLYRGVVTRGLGNYYRKNGYDSLRFLFYIVTSGFDGEYTESNQRLMQTPAWASPQKWRVPMH